VNKVLLLDSDERLKEFRELIGDGEDINFIYTDNLHQALERIKEEDIQVLLLGGDINGSTAESLPFKIKESTGKDIEVVLNCFKQDTCRIKKDFYMKSNLLDVIYPTTDKNKIIKKIKVALEARRLNSFKFFEESEI
jgi:DNA-binding NtrC family response regulator